MCFRLFILSFVLFLSPGGAWADESVKNILESDRELYQKAKDALRKGQLKQFKELSGQLLDYPLYPYLRYNYLRSHISSVSSNEIRDFLVQQSDFPSTSLLHQRWLRYLARTKQWRTYAQHYSPQESDILRCYYLTALMETKKPLSILDEIREVWLSDASLPSLCDPAFALLYQSELMTDELIWKRLSLVLKKNNHRLARYLSDRMSPEQKTLAKKWIELRRSPEKLSSDPNIADSAAGRQVIIDVLNRLVRVDLDRAINYWQVLQQRYDFTPDESNRITRSLAIQAVRQDHPSRIDILDKIPAFYVDRKIFHLRLISALGEQDWEKLKDWTEGAPENDIYRHRWYYWHARALENTGETEHAKRVYSIIAGERDYYGFMAADRLGIAYNMQYAPIPVEPTLRQQLMNLPAMRRILELHAIGEHYEAREEWHYALTYLNTEQKKQAAVLAAEQEWHDLAIISLASANAFDYLDIRFPLPYKALIEKYANEHQLDFGWLYSLVRAESAFVEDIRSPAGALGLMQLMPVTARETARKLGVKNFKTRQLLLADQNVPLGSAYLRQMLNRYHGNKVLATAAYNAGPYRVDRWLTQKGCTEPDVWIEQIPFPETRKYVSRIMFYASIYDWRMQNPIQPVAKRMERIPSSPGVTIAGLACSGQQLSYN